MTELPDRPAGVAGDPVLLNALLAHWRPFLIVVARRRMGAALRFRHRGLAAGAAIPPGTTLPPPVLDG